MQTPPQNLMQELYVAVLTTETGKCGHMAATNFCVRVNRPLPPATRRNSLMAALAKQTTETSRTTPHQFCLVRMAAAPDFL